MRDFSLIRVIKGAKKGKVLPCSSDQRLLIGSDEDQCDLLLQGEEVSPVHASVFFDPVNRLFGVRDMSDQGMILEDGLPFPREATIHIPEGTILYLGSRDQAIILGSKNSTSYGTQILPKGTLIREKYIIESKPLQICGGMMYNGIRIRDGDSSAGQNPVIGPEGQNSSSEDRVHIFCTIREAHKPYDSYPVPEEAGSLLEIVNEYDVIFFVYD